MTSRDHIRTLIGPIIMGLSLFFAFTFRLADKPHYGLAVVLLYSLLWAMAPRIATAIAILTAGWTAGDLVGSLMFWLLRL